MKLHCALLGEEAVFPGIDERASVGRLKNLIKLKRTNRIKCDAFDMQLYLSNRWRS